MYYIISDVIVRLDKRRIVEKIDLKAVSSQSKSRFESCGGERKGVKAESGFSQESNSLPSSRGIGRSSSRTRTKGSSVNGPLDLWGNTIYTINRSVNLFEHFVKLIDNLEEFFLSFDI